MSLTYAEAAEQERIRIIYATMPRRTDEELAQILANPRAEFHVLAAAADVQRHRLQAAQGA